MKVQVILLLILVCWTNSDLVEPKIAANSFILSLEYACRSGVSLFSCEANIIWNNEILVSIEPKDYKKKSLSFTVKPETQNINILSIMGTGISDGYGLTINNVKLSKNGHGNSNIVENGDFESPPQNGGWTLLSQIKGWYTREIQVGAGKIYSGEWNSQVCELDGTKNDLICQAFAFNSDNHLISLYPSILDANANIDYTLEFDWGIRPTTNLDSYQGAVVINNQLVSILTPKSLALVINHESIKVKLAPGLNTLSFDGAGLSDGLGIVIDNVKLTTATNLNNLVFNGDFEIPILAKNQWQLFLKGIRGWSAVNAEVGDCLIYSSAWTSGQCLELDSTTNQRYTQNIFVPY